LKTTLLGLLAALFLTTQTYAQAPSKADLILTGGIISSTAYKVHGDLEMAFSGKIADDTSYIVYIGTSACLDQKTDTFCVGIAPYDTLYRDMSASAKDDPFWLHKMEKQLTDAIFEKLITKKQTEPLFVNFTGKEYADFVTIMSGYVFQDWMENRNCSYLFNKAGLWRIANPTGNLDLSSWK
jgi:hypothetical protein